MILIVSHNEKMIKLIIAEKDKIKLRYKQKLNDIKQHYGIEFDIEHLTNDDIKSITFYNLKYKNTLENLSITYNNSTKKIDYIRYEFSDSKSVKSLDHKKIVFQLDKEYKLRLLIAEINRVNEAYKKEIECIEDEYKKSQNNDKVIEKLYQVNRNENED